MKRILWLVLIGLLAACSSSADLPSGPDLLKRSAAAMAAVKTVAFTLATEGSPPVPVRRAEGDLTREGDAKGSLQIMIGALQEFEFVLVGDAVYLKGPTGGFQKSMSRDQLAAIYDPGMVITGVPELLAAAQNPAVQSEESGAYKVNVTLPPDQLKKVVPGVTQGVPGTLLIDKATSRLTRIDLTLTGGKVTVTLADYDAPVDIAPPPV